MDPQSQSRAAIRFGLFLLGLAFLAVVATGVIAFQVTTPPRGFIFWTITLFLCAVELVVGLLSVHSLTARRTTYRLSGAGTAIVYGMVGAYAVVGFISILLCSALRQPAGGSDHLFLGILAAETVLAFVIAALIYGYEIQAQVQARPSSQSRTLHAEYASSLKTAIHALHNVSLNDSEQNRSLAILVKKLERIGASLDHSHGGGIGSREGGFAAERTKELDPTIAEMVTQIVEAAAGLPPRGGADMQERLARMNDMAANLDATLDRIGL